MSNHTPGQWRLKKTDGQDFTVIETSYGSEVLGVSEWLRAKPEDLRLMALAPTMLEELEYLSIRLQAVCEDYEDIETDIDLLKKLIAEAKGESG